MTNTTMDGKGLEYLQTYVDGFRSGDSEQVYEALDDDFVLSDPDCGDIPKANFKLYFAGLWLAVERRGGIQPGGPFLEIDHVMTRQEGDHLIAWARWRFQGTDLEGASLFTVGPMGLLSEQLYNKTSSGRR